MTTSNQSPASGSLTTSNATVTSIMNWPIANNASGVVQARISAREQGANQARSWWVTAAFRRDGSGNLTVGGSLLNLLNDSGTLGAVLWDVSVASVSGQVVIQVKGAAANNVDWIGYGDAEWLEQ
jgi:hypothetical protein